MTRSFTLLAALACAGCITQTEAPAAPDRRADPQIDMQVVDAGARLDDAGLASDADLAPAPPPDASAPPPPADMGEAAADAAPLPAPPRWIPEAIIEAQQVVRPLDIVCLDAADFLPAEVVDAPRWAFEWRVAEHPANGGTTMVERFQDPRRPRDTGIPDDASTTLACMFVPSVGEYLIELGARDLIARATVIAARVRVSAASPDGIHIELTWETPGDPDQTDAHGTDVDLHVRHPDAPAWAVAPFDCFYANASPDWGAAGPAGDPSLDIDDVNGAGPEHINLASPEDTAALGGHYLVGVDYYRAEDFAEGRSWGPSTATIRIFLGGALAYEGQREMQATHHFWTVAAIEWIDGVGRVLEIDDYAFEVPDEP